MLVGTDIADEYQSIVLLDLLHGTLGVEWVKDDLKFIEAGLTWDGLARVLWLARELKGLGLMEGSRQTDLADFVGVNLMSLSVAVDGLKRR